MLAPGDNGQRDHAVGDRPLLGQNHSQTCSGRRSTECLGALQLALEPLGRPTPPRASETTWCHDMRQQASGVRTLAAIARTLQGRGIKTAAERRMGTFSDVEAAGGLGRRSRAQTSGRPTCPCATSHCNRLQSLGPSAACLGVDQSIFWPRPASSQPLQPASRPRPPSSLATACTRGKRSRSVWSRANHDWEACSPWSMRK